MIDPAIVISSDTTGLAVIRSLGRRGVPVVALYYDANNHGYVSRYVRERGRVPHPERREEEFVRALLDGAPRWEGGVLFPCSDAALATVSRYKASLASHYRVACPEWQIAQAFLDKKHTYELARSIGVPAPRTIVLRSMEDVEKHGPGAEYPCLVKPSQGHRYFELFRTKMVLVKDFDELLAAYVRAAEHGLEVMLQEFIPGEDSRGVNYNGYFADGKPVAEFTAEKLASAPPTLGSPCVVKSSRIPGVLEAGRKLLAAACFYGFACTEFKEDARDGVYKLMEVNGRHNLSAQLAIRCGLDFPWIEYRHLVQGVLPQAGESDYEVGVYWIDLVRHLGNSLKYFGQGSYRPGRILEPYLHPHVFATLDGRDPRPFLKRCAHLVGRAFGRGRGE